MSASISVSKYVYKFSYCSRNLAQLSVEQDSRETQNHSAAHAGGHRSPGQQRALLLMRVSNVYNDIYALRLRIFN